MRFRAAVPFVLPFLAALPLRAQTVDGVLLDQNGRAPVGRAMVKLIDARGRVVMQTQTKPDGRFLLVAPGAGTYRVRAEVVGRPATVSDAFPLEMGRTVPFELLASGEAVRLEGLVAHAGERACAVRHDTAGSVATVWEEARKALAAAEWTRLNEPRDFTVRRWSREMDAASLTVKKEEASTARTRRMAPFRALSAGELAERGYVQRQGREYVYFAPDAEVLLSDAFLDTHCFRLERDPQKQPGMVGLAFEPARGRRLPDVNGVLWLDEKTAELRHVDYEYTRVTIDEGNDRRDWGARGERQEHSWGGRIDFDRMHDGVWFVRRWSIRMPVTGAAAPEGGGLRAQTRIVLAAVKEDGAEVLGLRTMRGEVVIADQAPGGAAVRGMVFDSTRARGLASATVFLVGTEYVTQTDSTGAFRLENVPDGRYGIAFSHPRADSMVYVPDPVEVELARGRVDSVHLSLGHPSRVAAAAASQGRDAVELEAIRAVADVSARRLQLTGFLDRQKNNTGIFLTADQFVARGGARVIDRIQGLRGVYARVEHGRGDGAMGGGLGLRISTSRESFTLYQYRFGRRCTVSLWINGIERPPMDLLSLQADDVEAVEVYSGDEVPHRFRGSLGGPSVCGAVVVWLKAPRG